MSTPGSGRRAASSSLLLAAALAGCGSDDPTLGAGGDSTPGVAARGETQGSQGDPDDPAIWVNAKDPAKSTIIGTDKTFGLYVYDLSGRELQALEDGDMNSVDLRAGFSLGGSTITLVTAGNRTSDTMAFYAVDESSGTLTRLPPLEGIPTEIVIYGHCMHRAADGGMYLFLNDKEGHVVQWRVAGDESGAITAETVRTFQLGSQLEGCVADDELGRFYVGEEDVGIWRFDAAPDAPAGDADRTLVAKADGATLVADVEGLSLYLGQGDAGYLLASSQGDNAYAVFERGGDNAFIGRFRVVAGELDAASESDGIDVTSAALPPLYPHGLFVAHDTRDEGYTGNFKLVGWEDIATTTAPPLLVIAD